MRCARHLISMRRSAAARTGVTPGRSSIGVVRVQGDANAGMSVRIRAEKKTPGVGGPGLGES